jgi:Uma2 family endonuclease
MSSTPLQKRPTLLHQHVSGRLYRAIADWVDSPSGRGTVLLPLSIAIGPGNPYTPGLMWFEDELLLDAERVPRMPDLLIRVDDGAALRAQNDWEYGPRELWLVNLDSWSVKVHRSDGTWERREDDDLISPQMPGFRVQVDALFP